ncbi:hypothetical protein EJ03DRAFT_386069 [Teratosphaeria nubilosa]|uniref:CRIB domain-containing protein n=1 Tax=Teratosphaeria nubilosa TaxID=161662 RepID=A0A6G1KUF0_9PEZI|nr:hypothetical protein EJ03DRAFT_386069 [Teratosphaeria nubilosa]
MHLRTKQDEYATSVALVEHGMDYILDSEPKQLLRSTSLLSSTRHHVPTPEAWRPPPSRDSTASGSNPINDTQGRMRKRHSFFARSHSETSKLRRTPTTVARNLTLEDNQDYWQRPGTAQSIQPRRRKTEHLESLRNSIFGGKKRTHSKEPSVSSIVSRSGSRNSNADANMSRIPFKTEEDYYHHLRKSTISPPFNFEHVTHTARKQLPSLETVNEKDLKAEFWGASAYQRPKRSLNGIQAEDLTSKLPRMGVERHSPSSRPTSPMFADMSNQRPLSPTSPARRYFGSLNGPEASIDETLFDEVRETKFDPDVALETLHSTDWQQNFRHPKRYASMGAIREAGESGESSEWPLSPASLKKSNRESYVQLPPPTITFDESEHSNSDAPSDHTLPRRETPIIISPKEPSTPISEAGSESTQQTDAPPETAPNAQHTQINSFRTQSPELAAPEATRSQTEHIDRSQQPLPPVPTQQRPASRGPSQNSACISRSEAPSSISQASSDRPSSIRSRSSKSASKSPAAESNATSASGIASRCSFLSDLTWEDDVDFLYEQNAESTCNFDWQQGPVQSTLEQDVMNLRLSGWGARSFTTATSTPMSLRKLSDDRVATLALQEGNTHSRGSSVGHRGFLAARRGTRSRSKSSSSDGLHKQMTPPPPLDLTPTPAVEVTPKSPNVSVLSPVLSIDGEEDSAAPATKPPFSPGTLHFHNFDSGYRGSAEYLSDPESNVTRRSKHSKSSSYGSYDSGTRSTPSTASRETARWSSASSASVPELMHSHKRRSKVSLQLHKSIISRPLESLPQSPGSSAEETEAGIAGEESSIVPRASQVEPMRNTFILQRLETTSERIMLQNAGRTVQRGRPSTAGRLGLFPRIASVEEQEQKHRRAASAGPGAGWL